MAEFQITDTREEILKILEERGAVLQKDLWKELNIDSSKCSRILRKLEKEGLIKRVEVVVDGVKTFKIIPAGAEEEVEEEEELDLKAVLDRMEEVAGYPPCFACTEIDCDAKECIKLEVWFLGKCRMLG
ncbi:MAG: Transcriptional repressor (CinR) [Archaeoglobus fulgidus]|uniref:Transcriptional repressor (CinR) n=1 Tax=Archaeoglobus fulgidus TaxID=2234 RepID=A0A101E0L7_ARCFL|nr:Lrp/AsnC family transcriptional regulator [Archaeoglobus fulgidus]KUJ94338.1 MAG: Transcriptional repressor (CinR) [Archaeoglobus fulgidus]KUK06362.1 MAG: Transcriptional repressor (CinR) [Archaeoglobus fulgidus]